MLDFRSERRKFPTLAERIYFDSQSLGPCPVGAFSDLRAYERTLLLRTRGLREWTERLEEMHQLTERLLGAPSGTVFLRDSSTAAQAAIAAAVEPSGSRRRILIASGDFHSSRYLWASQARRGFDIVEVESNSEAHAFAETFTSAIDECVSIVALSLVSPRTGALLDARAIAEAAHRAGAMFVLDAYQAVGIVPVDVTALGADAIVGGFHKWVGGGGTGLAFGYLAPALSERLEPVYPGWLAHEETGGFHDRFSPAPNARKFQQGMPSMEPIYTSRAGLEWVLDTGIDAIRARSILLTNRLIQRATEAGLPVRTPSDPRRRGGTVCIDVPSPETMVAALAEQRIDVGTRRGAGLRIGPHPCSLEEECDQVIAAIAARLG